MAKLTWSAWLADHSASWTWRPHCIGWLRFCRYVIRIEEDWLTRPEPFGSSCRRSGGFWNRSLSSNCQSLHYSLSENSGSCICTFTHDQACLSLECCSVRLSKSLSKTYIVSKQWLYPQEPPCTIEAEFRPCGASSCLVPTYLAWAQECLQESDYSMFLRALRVWTAVVRLQVLEGSAWSCQFPPAKAQKSIRGIYASGRWVHGIMDLRNGE